MTARDTERGRERQREIPRWRQRNGRERMKRTQTKRPRKRESTQPYTPSSSARFTQTLTLLGRRPAVRRKPLKSGRRPRARSLAGGLRLVTEGYIRSPPLPPTLLLDLRYTPRRPPVDPRPNPVDRFLCCLPVFLRMLWKTSFFTVFRGLRRRRLAPNRAPVVSVMRAARTGLIDISWVLGTEVA